MSNTNSSLLAQVRTSLDIKQSALIEQYIYAKLAIYKNKSRLWQLIHSSQIERRLLNKADRIARLHFVSTDLVREYIAQIFEKIDGQILELRHLIQTLSQPSMSVNIPQKELIPAKNSWRNLQLERARALFSNNLDSSDSNDDLIEIYYAHIKENLTPKLDLSGSNPLTQFRKLPFDLNGAFECATNEGKTHLQRLLNSYRGRSVPDLNLIKEMVNLGLKHKKRSPSNEEFETAGSFLAKVSLLFKMRKTYETNVCNTADDFFLLLFGKTFGSNTSEMTKILKNQFVYLCHLFLKSVSHLGLMMQTDFGGTKGVASSIYNLITNVFLEEKNSSLIEVPHDLMCVEINVDQWTWLLEKWRETLRTFPIILTETGAFVRLLHMTIGITIIRIYSMAETMVTTKEVLNQTALNEELFQALQIGFYFGVTYAIVDGFQDEIQFWDQIPAHHIAAFQMYSGQGNLIDVQNMTPVAIVDMWLSVMEQMLCRVEIDRSSLPKTPLTPLLLETFDSLVVLTQRVDRIDDVFNEVALLLRSQRADIKKMDEFYDDENLYLGTILKSHFTSTSANLLGNAKSALVDSERQWLMPFLGQLIDDCQDFYNDVTSKSITPFTHYSQFAFRQKFTNKSSLNPFYILLYVCSDVYLSSNRDITTGAFLGRCIARILGSIELSNGSSALHEFIDLFCHDNLQLAHYFWTTCRLQYEIFSDWDKMYFRKIDAWSIQYARTNRKLETYIGDHLMIVEDSLKIDPFSKIQETGLMKTLREEEILITAMNYSVKAGGKRLRPLLMLMVSDLYGIEMTKILPLVCGIEYLHTSSLIFDDLPAQDNSDLRRGRPTLHNTAIDDDVPVDLYEARAQLAAIDLIAVSLSLINQNLVKNGFSAERVNQVVSEISLLMHDLCVGQMMDLRGSYISSESNDSQLDRLDCVAWLKTGKALEVAFLTPAILGASSALNKQDAELTRICELTRLMGILFQMRDDLLDVECENIGKPIALDVKNNTVTYVSILGVEGTRQRLKEICQQALLLVDECWPSGAETIKDVIRHIVKRKH